MRALNVHFYDVFFFNLKKKKKKKKKKKSLNTCFLELAEKNPRDSKTSSN